MGQGDRILVIVVTYNAMRWAERCFQSLQASTVVPDVFVVDNGSADGTQAYIKATYPQVLLTENHTNLGFGKANNFGLQYALDNNYDYVYLLNQDAWVMPDTLEILIRVSKAHPEYAILSPLQVKADGSHLDDLFIMNVIYQHQQRRPYWIDDMCFNRQGEVYEVSFVMAAHWLMTRKCIETVGGFNPSFPHYGEDDNYVNRVNYWDMKAGIVPTASAVHDEADPVWSKEKWSYILDYISPMIHASNPLATTSLLKYIIIKAGKALVLGDRKTIQYAFRLLRERRQIKDNLKASTLPKAFLD